MNFFIFLLIALLANCKLAQDMVKKKSSFPTSFMLLLSVTDSDINKL